jgi:Fe2+ transport system protein FeoA
MGVTPGTVVEVERVAPLGDPIDIKVKGYHLSLRKEEAEGIEVELL